MAQKPECTCYIVRHGQTDWNVQERFQGHTDIPLNAIGRKEALQLQEEFGNIPFHAAYASDLSRAHETARIILEKRSIETTLCQWLRERHYGTLEGTTHSERVAMYQGNTPASMSFSAFIEAQKSTLETPSQLFERVSSNLYTLSQKHPNQNVLIVTHGGVILHLLKQPHIAKEQQTWTIENCCWVKLKVHSEAYIVEQLHKIHGIILN